MQHRTLKVPNDAILVAECRMHHRYIGRNMKPERTA